MNSGAKTREVRSNFSATLVEKLTDEIFGIKAAAFELPGERDQNFHLKSDSDEEYVLKISNAEEKKTVLDLQNKALYYLNKRGIPCPAVVSNKAGELISKIKADRDKHHFVRLLTYLPGKPLAKINPHSPELLQQTGNFLGQLSQALQDFEHPAAQRDFYWDLKNASSIIRLHKNEITNPERLKLVETYLGRFEKDAAPKLSGLRTSIVHHDANDYNLIVDGNNESAIGIIDFGDMVQSCTIFELAVCCAYVMLGKKAPLKTAAAIVRGYHAQFPLTELELELLFNLICARLAMSVCISAHQQKMEPKNEYLKITEKPAWELLAKLKDIHPRFAHYTFRNACGLPPSPKSSIIINWLQKNQKKFAGLVPANLKKAPVTIFDLSVGSLQLGSPRAAADVDVLTNALFKRIAETGAEVGIGRYDEARLLYTSKQFVEVGVERAEQRTIHLGIDLFLSAGSPIFAPLNGKVHSFKDNNLPLDYGPTLILEHQTSDGVLFYTLYGHLSRDSLEGLVENMPIKKDQEIARLGTVSENGGWPPHLHFQIILDLLDHPGNYPGVAAPCNRDLWLGLCPDPNFILGLPKNLFSKPGHAKEKTERLRQKYLGPNLSLSYKSPLKIVRGFMQYLYDETGQPYLDAVNNVAHVGHSHPRIVEALAKQAAVLNTNTRYLHDTTVEYAERLCAKFHDPLEVCYFVCSGSEANELALRLARTYTRRTDIIVVEGAYHGNTANLIDISPYKFDGPGGAGQPPHVHKVPMPDTYRGRYRRNDDEAGQKYAGHVQNAIAEANEQGTGVAAFICESLPGCGGQINLPRNYLKEAFQYVRNAGGVCIADEVQVGFGRVGSHFWGFETQGVVPDIVTLGKPIGNGHPLAAVVTTKEIASAFSNGMEYFNTFGGNPVSCAVGLAVLDVIADEGLQKKAAETGKYLMHRLTGLQKTHPIIGDVRGLGLFIGIELVLDRETLAPAPEQATYIINRMKARGILLSTDGPLHNVLKIKPPLTFNINNADFFVQNLNEILFENFCQI